MEQEDEPRLRETLASIELTLIMQKAENKKGLGVGGGWENTKMWGPKPTTGAPVKKCTGTRLR